MIRFGFAALSVLLLACTTQGAVLLNDNFDGYADQAAFQSAWPVVGTQPTATLSTEQAFSAPNSVHVPSSSTTATSPRNGRSFTESGTLTTNDQLLWSFRFFDEAPTGNPYRQHANLQDGTAPTGTNQLVAMGLNNNQLTTYSGGNYYMARILGYNVDGADADTVPDPDPDGGPTETVAGSGAFFKLNDFGVGLRSAGWHELTVVLTSDDAASTDYAFYVDGELAELVSNVGTAASLRSYDHIRIGSGVSSPSGAFYDNMVVEFSAIPEPSSLALFALAGLITRRRQRAA